MNQYEVSNIKSAHFFGVYEAESADAAIEACCKDAGFESKAQAEEVMGHGSDLVAAEITGLVYLAVGQRGLVLAHFMLHEDAAQYCRKIGNPELIVLPYKLNNRGRQPAPLVGTHYRA